MPTRKSIHLFDLDDTLIATQARILVRDGRGDLVKSLTPAAFTTYALDAGEVFDFREFSDVGILSQGIVVHYTREIIDQLVRRGTRSHFGILTARGDKGLHAAFLMRLFRDLFGIRLRKSLIFAVSDVRFSRYKDGQAAKRGKAFSHLSISERKALVVLEDLIASGYNDISFYDDSRENLNAFKHLAAGFPQVTFKAHFIDPTWTRRLHEFAASGVPEKVLNAGASSARLIAGHHARPQHAADFIEAEWENAAARLHSGEAIALRGFPVELIWRDQRYRLRRISA